MAEHKVAPPADSAAEVTGLAAMGCSMAASESGRGPDANPDASDVIVGVDEWRDVITLRSLRRNLARRFWNQTWTLASLRLTLLARSSLTYASG